MKIKKSKTKIIVLSVCSVLAIIGFLTYSVELYHRTNDPNKERIFEIEDCARNRKLKLYDYEKELPYNAESVRVFMIQDCPNNEEDTKNLIYEFLDAYDYKNEMKKYNTDKFVVNFMIILYNTWVLMISKRGLILSKIYGKGEKNEKNG